MSMRLLLGLLLVLLLVPASAWSAPCCDEAVAEACCPLDRDCAATDTCPGGTETATPAPAPAIVTPPATPLSPVVLLATIPSSANARSHLQPRFLPLRN
jgi:hypothetical protein